MYIKCLLLFPAVGILECGGSVGLEIFFFFSLTCDVYPLLFIRAKGPIVQTKHVLSGGQNPAVHTIMK